MRRLWPLVRPLAGRATHRLWRWAQVSGAIGPGHARAERFGFLGEGACLGFPQGPLLNEHAVHIGAGTLVCPHVALSVGMAPGQPLPPLPVVRIGERCTIGRGSSVVGHLSIEIGDDVVTGPNCYVTDQNHAYTDPTAPIGLQWPPVDEPVVIGDGCWLGAGVVVLPGSRLGRNVAVAAGSVVRGEFPDHCVIAGAPARVVRRYVDGDGWVAANPAAPCESAPGSRAPARDPAAEI